MSRKRRNRKIKRARILAVVMTLFFIAVPIVVNAQSQATHTKCITVVVESGDTLWAIASEYTDNTKDVRETIYNIKKLNNIKSGMLVPGQELQIPVK